MCWNDVNYIYLKLRQQFRTEIDVDGLVDMNNR